MSLKERVEKLEQYHSNSEERPITFITVICAGESRPTEEDLKKAEEAFVARFGEPTKESPAIITCMDGFIHAGAGLERTELGRYSITGINEPPTSTEGVAFIIGKGYDVRESLAGSG
jgi:hypothetical protein